MAVGAIIAAAVAVAGLIANEVRSSNAASDAEDEAERQRRLAEEDAQFNARLSLAEKYSGQTLHGTRLNHQKGQIGRGYDSAMKNIDKQRSAQQTGNYMNAGAQLVNIGSNVADNWNSYFPSGGQEQAFQGFDNDAMGQRAQDMNLSARDFGLLNGGAPAHQPAPIRPADPMGGFQLQEQDSPLLGGAAPYSDSPFADDPYGTASPYLDPSRYRFRL